MDDADEKKQSLLLRQELEKALGMAVEAVVKSPLYAGRPLKEIYEQLLPALLTGQYRVVRNEEGESVAYISWALISEEVEKKMEEDGILRLSEWKSGTLGFVMDVAARNAAAGNLMVSRLKGELFKDAPLKVLQVKDGQKEMIEVPLPESSSEKITKH